MRRIWIERGDGIEELRSADYVGEDELQSALAEHPALLGGDLENPPRFVLIRRETKVGLAREGWWSLDHLFVDDRAIPTLVEVKRAADTRIRREVVGQLLDYAAYLSRTYASGQLANEYAAGCGDEPSVALAEALGLELDDVPSFWQTVDANLKAGRLRLVFLADRIPLPLLRTIELLNQTTRTLEVWGVEVPKWHTAEHTRIWVPKVVGWSKAEPSSAESFTLEEFYTALGEASPEALAVVEELHSWWEQLEGDVATTRHSNVPNLRFRLWVDGTPRPMLNVRSDKAWLMPDFMTLSRLAPFDSSEERTQLLAQLRDATGVLDLDPGPAARGYRARIQLVTLAPEGRRNSFKTVYETAIERIRRCDKAPAPRTQTTAGDLNSG